MDFTVIEILEEDSIIDFLEIDKFINSKDYKDEGIFSIQYPRELKIQFSAGKIMDKKDNLFSYSIEMDSDSSGSPILLMANSKVIGLHTDRAKTNNIKENIGIPLNLIINNINYIKKNPIRRSKYDYLFKLLIIGEQRVGKKDLLLKFTDDSFTSELGKTGIDFKIKIISIENKLIKLQIWYTTSQGTITNNFYRNSNWAFLAYDITDQNSFKNINKWNKQIEINAPPDICKILIGNKCDKSGRVINEEEGKKLANEINANFFETSAKTNQNVNEVFYFLAAEILKNNAGKTKSDNIVLSKEKNKKREKKKC